MQIIRKIKTGLVASAVVAICLAPLTALAQGFEEIESAAQSYVDGEARALMSNSVVVDAVHAQNKLNSGVTQSDIDTLDQAWRKESAGGAGSMIEKVLDNGLSAYLKDIQEQSQGLITEILVMDNKGLNVGQSEISSDFWQGDEHKWIRTYKVGPDALFVDEVELDESTQTYQTQASFTIVDSKSGEVIGAVTFGMDAEILLSL